jgi:hypothetical protein
MTLSAQPRRSFGPGAEETPLLSDICRTQPPPGRSPNAVKGPALLQQPRLGTHDTVGGEIAAWRRNKLVRLLIMRSMNVNPLMMSRISVCVRQRGSHDHD